MEASDSTDAPAQPQGPISPALEDLDALKVDDLKALAAERGLEGVSKLAKDDLVEAIRTGVVPVTGSARVAVSYPHDGFNHGIEGVPLLTRTLTAEPVSAAKLARLREKAKASGVPLREVAG